MMTDLTARNLHLRQWPVQATAVETKPAVSTSSQADDPDFKQLLTALIMSMGMQNGNSLSGDSSIGIGALLAPLMMNLFEEMNTEQAQPVEQKVVAETVAPANNPSGMPIKGRLTQSSHPGHVALDFGAPVGTPVKATMDGKVIYAGWNNEGYGNLVIVQNGPYKTYFAHLSKIPVSVGDTVTKGMVVGKSGNTGNSTGPHLHYEVRKNNRQIDPGGFTLK